MNEIYQDIDIFGNENYNGTPKEYFDRDALKNALTMWLMTKRGDFIDSPGEGGILDSYTFKNLTRENEEKLKFRIESSLNTYFSEIIELIDITIVPNATLRFTEVTITYNDLLNGEQNQITVYPKEFSKKVVIKYEDVFLDGENLFNFVKIKKPSMVGQKIVFSVDEGKWVWGNRLRFLNFSFSDPFFEQIIEYINVL